MKAIVIDHNSGGSITFAHLPEPTLKPGQVRIRVHAASVNRADLLQRNGAYHSTTSAPALQPLGLDVAGEIIEVSSDVGGFVPGDRVMTMVGGGYAEQVVVDASMLLSLPRNWSYVEGAAAVVGFMTSHNALITAARMASGETVCVHAATSAVGLQSVQLARYLGASQIIGTSRSGRGRDLLKRVGVDELVDTSVSDFASRALEVTRGQGLDVILDYVGGGLLPDNVAAAAIQGRIIGIGRLGGSEGTLDMEALAFKRLEIVGVTFRTRSAAEKSDVVQALCRDIPTFRPDTVDNQAPEELRPIIYRALPWSRIDFAHELMEENKALGKLVLEVEQ
ncbi:zinc-binding dehydrogenase [Rhodococcus sp. DMU1]|uniref:zinc-binding dehydrogenase n=1 Tax=Rhodococcus TaxID=1827 RepID=UPI001FF0ADFA|nr:zinc-binding dehydrogenase [Rhodococcus sp. DMU1]